MARPRTGKALTAPETAPSTVREQVLAKRDLLRTLARAHGAVSLELFGSTARREDRPDSDIDMMVELEEGRSLIDLITLGEDLQAALGRKVDLVSKSSLKPRVLSKARKDAVRLV
jgi:predicted nucleotidyltransferase